jgi:Zn ribbon nucleic-acid-binding protein
MRIKVEMYIEISKENAEDHEIESHLRDALFMYEGNDLEFVLASVESITNMSIDEKDEEFIAEVSCPECNQQNAVALKKEFDYKHDTMYYCRCNSCSIHFWKSEYDQWGD